MLTAQGFKRKRYDDYIEEMEALARSEFGSDVNLGDASPLGKFIKILAFARAEDNEMDEMVYNSAFYDTAEGVSLDRVAKRKGLTRKPKQKAIGTIDLVVDPGLTVEAGLIVATSEEVEFRTIATVTDEDEDGLVTAPIEAIVAGREGNVPANTIKTINTPVVGVDSCNNSNPTERGSNEETDVELRIRIEQSSAKDGLNTSDSIRAALLDEVPGLSTAIVIENNSDLEDVDGRPPHSFETIVLGGSSEDIASIIMMKKPGGIQAYGQETVIVKDNSGNDQTIGFSFANMVYVHMDVNLVTNASFPSNGQNMVISELVKYVGGVDADYQEYGGLPMGGDVIHARALSAVFSVPGIVDATLEFSVDEVTYSADNIVIGRTEVAATSFERVVVTVG